MAILPIPLIWRKLLYSYVLGLLLAMSAFILILLTLRLNDIAHFATLGGSQTMLLWFTLYQIAYILPLSLPIASFISSFLLMDTLVYNSELTALRALGLSLQEILFPILSAATFFGLVNFILISEVASQSSLAMNTLKTKIRDVNPILLLQNKPLLKLKGITATTLGQSKIAEYAEDTILTLPAKGGTHLIAAKGLRSEEGLLLADQLTFIGQVNNHIVVENVKGTITTTDRLLPLFQDQKTALQIDQLNLKSLLALLRKSEGREKTKCETEILRRLSAALSLFTFSFLALSFALSNNRVQTKKNLILSLILIGLYLLTTILAKEAKTSLSASLFLFFAPQALSFILSIKNIRYFSQGKI